MFPLTRPWAWAFLIIGLIGAPFALVLVLRVPNNGYGYINVACSLAFIAIGVYRIWRPVSPR
jgi:hypothetical protein